MKFGEELNVLKIDEWCEAYLQYETFKNILKSRNPAKKDKVKQKPGREKVRTEAEITRDFFNLLEKEVDKIQVFYMVHVRAFQQMLSAAQLIFYSKRDANKSEALRIAEIKAVNAAVHHIVHDFNLLTQYVQLNRTALRKILKKYDKLMVTETKLKVLFNISKNRSFYNAHALQQQCESAERFMAEVSRYTLRRNWRL